MRTPMRWRPGTGWAPKDAIEHYKRLVADTEAAGGHDHPDAIAARTTLASAYGRSGKLKDAIALYQRVLADHERTAGADHPDTIAARASLAFAYRSAGQTGSRELRTHAGTQEVCGILRGMRDLTRSAGSYEVCGILPGQDPAKTGNSRLVRTRIASRKSIRRVCR